MGPQVFETADFENVYRDKQKIKEKERKGCMVR
jgi:hypothetical protein